MNDADVNAILMAQCLAWADRWDAGKAEKFPKRARDSVAKIIKHRARFARRPRESRIKLATISAPGYVALSVGKRQVQVPFHLVDAVPEDVEFELLFDLAEHVRLSSNSQICISGSSVFLGRISDISDIDFCEYVTVKPTAVQNDFVQRCALVTPALFVHGRVDKFEFRRVDGSSVQVARDRVPSGDVVKLDYVSLKVPFLLPLSNVSVFVDPATPEASVKDKSWAFQEIALGDEEPLLELTRPELLGRYMAWLRKEIDKYLDKTQKHYDPFKSLKRALSLGRVLGSSRTTSLYDSLQPNALTTARRRKSVQEALDMATAVADHGGDAAVQLLKDSLASLPDVADAADVEASRETCRELALAFRRHVDELVEWAMHELDEEPD